MHQRKTTYSKQAADRAARQKLAAVESAARKRSRQTVSSPAPTIPGAAILPLRLFLGVTFVYAALQKLTDPGFFKLGSGTYIGSQLLAYSRGSPIHGFLQHALEHAVLVGALTIFAELTIGLLVLLGLFTRPAALIGLFLNFVFFLSASWHTYPYFMGSDIVFVMCWLTLLLTGPGPFSLDPVMQQPLGRVLRARLGEPLGFAAQRLLNGPLPAPADTPGENTPAHSARPAQLLLSRGELLLGGTVSVLLVILGLMPRSSVSSGLAAKPAATGGATPAPSRAKSGAAGIPTGAKKIGNISQLPENSAGVVSDPRSGDPAIVIHAGSQFYAYDAVCTHAGCTVQYDPQSKLLVCPCHGGAFDPAHGAQVVAGPPPSPLTQLPMQIDSKGNIYLN